MLRDLPLLLVFALGCGADLYNHSRVYEPLDKEREMVQGAEEYDPVMARRQPSEWAKKKAVLFGIVTERQERDGKAYLKLSVRTLEGRNLCEDASDDSCRTTVSEVEHDQVHALVTFGSLDDELGQTSIGVGSLLRVVGSVSETVDGEDGKLVVVSDYYRHWPRGYFVTSAARGALRR